MFQFTTCLIIERIKRRGLSREVQVAQGPQLREALREVAHRLRVEAVCPAGTTQLVNIVTS